MTINTDIWEKLESGLPAGDKITAKLAMPSISKRVYVGLDSLKQRHLLISLEEKEEEYSDSQSRGLLITTKQLTIRGLSRQNKYIDIVCQDPAGYIIFNTIAGEIAEKINNGSPKEVVASVINKWRNFWGKPAKELLSYNEITGLFAELWFLCFWLIPKIDKLEAVNRWRGPLLSRHDFEWTGMSVEVKSTTQRHSRTHRIHGTDQLSPPEEGILLLFSLRINEEQGSNNTLPVMIASCREKLKDNIEALSRFDNLIAIIGYSPHYDEEYSKYKFRVIDEKLFNVTGEFPRITVKSFNNDVPPGVGMIEYSINLDGYDSLCIARSPDDNVDFH